MDESNCAGDRRSGAADERASSLRLAGEGRRQQGGSGASEDERDDRLSGGDLHRDLRRDADCGKRLLEKDPGRGARRADDERGLGQLASAERTLAVRRRIGWQHEQELNVMRSAGMGA